MTKDDAQTLKRLGYFEIESNDTEANCWTMYESAEPGCKVAIYHPRTSSWVVIPNTFHPTLREALRAYHSKRCATLGTTVTHWHAVYESALEHHNEAVMTENNVLELLAECGG